MTIAAPRNAFAKPVPTSIDAEQTVIGTALMDNRAYDIASQIVGPDDFADPLHAHIWRSIGTCIAGGRIASPLTISPLCRDAGDIAGMTPHQYLARLVVDAMPVEMVADLADVVRSTSVRRKLIALAERLDADARNVAGVPAEDALGSALRDLDEVRAALAHHSAKDRAAISDFGRSYLQSLQDRLAGRASTSALMCGIHGLDRQLGGFQRGGVTILAGRPGMGKTAFGVEIAYRLASAGYCGAFFSIEMGVEQIVPRFLAGYVSRTGHRLEYSRIMRAQVGTRDLEKMADADRAMRDWPLFLDTVASPTVAEIQSRCRSATASLGRPLDFVIVDYLGLVAASSRYQGQRTQEVGEVSRGMKALAKTTGAAVILLAQLNRQSEARSDKRPELADLRDSGEIEQDAEAVLFAFREAYYLHNKTDAESLVRLSQVERQMEIIVAKNRHGPTGTARLYCDIAANVIDDLEDR